MSSDSINVFTCGNTGPGGIDWYMILSIDTNGEATLDLVRRGSNGVQRSNGAVGQPGLMRTMNLRAAFEIVAAEGPVTATRLVQGTGLSKPTVSEVLRQLLDYGLIARAGRTSGQVGPSAQLYEVSSASGVVIGVDVGYEWVRVVSADLSGKVIARADERARRRRARDLIEQVGQLVEHVAGPIGSTTRYLAVVGTPGVFRPGDSHLALAPHLPGWERPEVLSSLRDRVACPVVFENDVNLAAIGELARGAGRGVRDFVLVSIGTGLGMGVVLDVASTEVRRVLPVRSATCRPLEQSTSKPPSGRFEDRAPWSASSRRTLSSNWRRILGCRMRAVPQR